MPPKSKRVRFDVDHCALCFKDKSYFEEWSQFPKVGCHFSCMLFASNLVQRYSVGEIQGSSEQEDDDKSESQLSLEENQIVSQCSETHSNRSDFKSLKEYPLVDRGFHCNDVLREVKRASRLKCTYCKKNGASIGCNVSKCRIRYHLPCAMASKAKCIYEKEFPVFCLKHSPKQNLSYWKKRDPNPICCVCQDLFDDLDVKALSLMSPRVALNKDTTTLRSMSLNTIQACETVNSDLWHSIIHGECCPPAWIHRECIMKWSSAAGLHHLRCPLCFNTDKFISSLKRMGIWIFDRDAVWEQTPSAFQELHETVLASCHANECCCPQGINFDDSLEWDLQRCYVCETYTHITCSQCDLNKKMESKWPNEHERRGAQNSLVDYVHANMGMPSSGGNSSGLKYKLCELKNLVLCFACINVALREIESMESRCSSPCI